MGRQRISRFGQGAARMLLVGFIAVEWMIAASSTWVYFAARHRVVAPDEVPVGSTALVLGAKVLDGEPGVYVRARLDTAVELFRAGRVTTIINSGNGSSRYGDETAVMRAYLETAGVPSSAIRDDPAGYDTQRSCSRARSEFGLSSVVLVTQGFHLDRAIALCRLDGPDPIGVAAPCDDCAWWSIARNHLREGLLARPRALLSTVLP
ncbi:MAG TPA: ElyC/SanA/YdcF family protein [Gordonia sp. (in: high G+C Gram-positive bacteria)]|uniref:SanA/YdcF family protein n=1 Tax=unclassified Gordonia (in: high G+C Gram-positive bacteria) TaxID=2657482 RepID=UPI0025B8388E|nr:MULTISPECIES: ElyC/SanA/YdcF family protein [unclassified Gordonia (in: high G+C Gram-positive bacteria)]HNP55647.1 ElyC/SanA/YdcF family protein [Gordonia sp. (in: high G+C Gram-positive bacteria)]HRC50759.1 ElyC/SanA/YdcF family protein [Gordonia sp. (in: high G+C Gram-positive bacteria)]